MANMTPREDFFEEDEPVDDIVAAFKRGEKGVTRRPQGRGATATVQLPKLGNSGIWHPMANPANQMSGKPINH